MEPVDAAAEVLAWAITGGLVLLMAVQLRAWIKPAPPVKPTANRVSDRELELLGEDWTVHTQGFVRKWSKRQAIVEEVCRGD